MEGDTTAFFKAVEIVHGKARQTLDVSQQKMKMFVWPDNSDVD